MHAQEGERGQQSTAKQWREGDAQTKSLILSPNAGPGSACASTFWSM